MEWLNKSIAPAIMKFVNTKGVTAVKNGMVATIPVIITGSIFLILAQLPVASWAAAMENSGLADICSKAYCATFEIDAIVAVLAIAYEYCVAEKVEPFGGAIIAMCAFFVLEPSAIAVTTDITGTEINAIAPGYTWTSGKGMVGSIIVGLIAGFVYSWFIKNDIRIKMPAGVPEGVANSFSALIPCIAIVTGATVIHGICTFTTGETFMEIFYDVVAAPLQGLADSLAGCIAYAFFATFLWMFGVHGAAVMGGIMGGLFQANQLENQAIFESIGGDLSQWSVNTPGVHIVTQQFIDLFFAISGYGITFGIVVYTLFFARSAQLKALAKVEVVPALFNVNEPFLFGVPICLNPFMAFPFILTPVISMVLEYVAISVGFIAPYTGVAVPWTTPPIVSGFIVGASGGKPVQTALLQLIVLVISVVMYFPFIKMIDNQNLAAEASAAVRDDDDDW